MSMSEIHDPWARECIQVGVPVEALHDRPCPACRELSAALDLDPDYGPASDGRPNLGPASTAYRVEAAR